jgi:hypothetical protein
VTPPAAHPRASFHPGPDGATATAEGACTYGELVAVTLAHGYVPAVVPRSRTTTLEEAVAGLGLGPSSFRNGLARGSVTAAGGGTYRVTVERARPFVALRTVRFTSLVELTAALALVSAERAWDGEQVDLVDGAVHTRHESYVVLGSWSDDVPAVSEYAGRGVYASSLRERGRDALTVPHYLWRWDTAPRGRARLRSLPGRSARDRPGRDLVVSVEEAAEFLDEVLGQVPERAPADPLWLCPLRRDDGDDRDRPPGTYVGVALRPGCWAVQPPSTASAAPVTKLASPESR